MREMAASMTMEDLPTKVADTQLTAEEMNKSLVREVGRYAVMVAAKLHRQLGHPGRDRLVQAARDSRLGDAVIKATKQYKCATCDRQSTLKPARPPALSSAACFNHVLLVDAFCVRWRGEKFSILAIMDAFSRFEQEAVLPNDYPETEIKLLEELWLRWAGPPAILKTDASGSHMSEKFVSWTDDRGIKLVIIPKDAHYRLGAMERAHAVRRSQLMKMHDEDATLGIETAVRYEQRNRLRTVHGSSPANIVFGAVPSNHGLTDEPFSAAAADSRTQQEVQRLRAAAAGAFHTANTDRALLASVLARARADPPSFLVGTYVFYYRAEHPDGRAGKLNPVGRWRGPALVCAIEEPRFVLLVVLFAFWILPLVECRLSTASMRTTTTLWMCPMSQLSQLRVKVCQRCPIRTIRRSPQIQQNFMHHHHRRGPLRVQIPAAVMHLHIFPQIQAIRRCRTRRSHQIQQNFMHHHRLKPPRLQQLGRDRGVHQAASPQMRR